MHFGRGLYFSNKDILCVLFGCHCFCHIICLALCETGSLRVAPDGPDPVTTFWQDAPAFALGSFCSRVPSRIQFPRFCLLWPVTFSQVHLFLTLLRSPGLVLRICLSNGLVSGTKRYAIFDSVYTQVKVRKTNQCLKIKERLLGKNEKGGWARRRREEGEFY